MITLADIEIQLEQIRAEKKFIIDDAKTRIAQLEVAEQALQRLAAPLRKEIALMQMQRAIELQSSCRPISLPF